MPWGQGRLGRFLLAIAPSSPDNRPREDGARSAISKRGTPGYRATESRRIGRPARACAVAESGGCMSQPHLIRRSLAEFFRDLVRGAMRTHEVESSEPAEHYLVSLLERFAKPAPGWDSRPLALEYLDTSRPHRCAKLKHVGDTSLFLSGVFMEHLERRTVSSAYYMSLGRIAYHQLAALAGDTATRADVFAEIAARFPDFVRVLSEISFAELFPNDSQTVRVYTRWLRTRGLQDAQWLLRRGIVP